MLQNYIKIALRTMLRNRSYSIINILGLSIGIACCLLLALYIQDEWQYDKHHQNLSSIFRITTHFQSDKGINELPTTSPPIGVVMGEEIPEIVSITRMVNPPGVAQSLIKYEDNMFYESDGYLADSTLFDVLTYEFTQGNPVTALVNPNSVVISDEIANKIFGDEPALNKTIAISQGGALLDYKITGVYKRNSKSFVNVNFFISMNSGGGLAEFIQSEEAMGEWAGQNFIAAFVQLNSPESKNEVIKKMNEVLVKYGAEDMKALGFTKTLSLEPVKDIYLQSILSKNQRITYLYLIGSIAIIILIIACINFMNLSTAKATKRAGEVGLRKVMGAFRTSLVKQFMGEAIVIVFISILVSIILVQLTLPVFNQITGKGISFNTENIAFFSSMLALITLITGILAGSYPALYLSSFQPAEVLKGKFILGNASGFLRRGLVVFQFMIAIVLVCSMIIISDQLTFMQEKDLGFNAKAKLILPLRTESASQQYETLKKELEKESAVNFVSATEYLPGSMIWSDMNFYPAGSNMDNGALIRRVNVDYGYLEMMDFKIIAGRSFTENRESDSDNKLILNQAAVKKMGFQPEDIIGEPLFFEWQGTKYNFEVIGVVEDFHQTSLKEEIFPTLFEMAGSTDQFPFLVMDVNQSDVETLTSKAREIWKQSVIDTPFEYTFLDQGIRKQYDEDRKVSKIISSFTFIAMFISCLGLYGLSMFMAERRFKEIGVRKVMGANTHQIVGLMSSEFIKLIAVAFCIAVPLAWYGMEQWLSGFAYKISINMMVFLYAGLGALAIALITVSFESFRAASTNPVTSLRSE